MKVWALVCMFGLTSCQKRDREKSQYFLHYLSSNNPSSGFESLFFLGSASPILGISINDASSGDIRVTL